MKTQLCALAFLSFETLVHARRTKPASRALSRGPIGYLTRDESSGGTLYFGWAEEGSVPYALASVTPGDGLKAYELKSLGQKKEIKRGISNSAAWFDGWVEFLQIARKKGTTVSLLHDEVQIALLYPNNELSVMKVTTGTPVSFNIQEVSVAAVYGVHSNTFDGVQTSDMAGFLSIAPKRAKGAVATFAGTPKPRDSVPKQPNSLPEDPTTPTTKPTAAEVGQGAYLIYSSEDSGTMFLHWSKIKIDGALAYFSSSKVAAWKYNGEGKKDKLKAKMGVNKKEYYAAWVSFLRQGFAHDGVFQLLNDADPKPVQVAMIETAVTDGSHVVHRAQVKVPVQLKTMEACAVVHKDSSAFKVDKMAIKSFLAAGASSGSSDKMKN